MTTRKELETIKNRVLKALNNDRVTRHKIRIKTKDDSDIIFFEDGVRIKGESFFVDLSDSAFVFHIMISYEDIKEIDDRTSLEVLYMKVN